MRAVVWNGRRDVRVENVPDPQVLSPADAIVRVTSSGICGSDLHLYEVLAPFMEPGDVMGHEPIGIVEEVGAEVSGIAPGDRVVVPFNVACGACWECRTGLQSQCATTRNDEFGTGGSLLGYTKLYGHLAGAQAEYVRVPFADYGLIPVPEGPPDDRYVYLSDVLPTAWQAVEYAGAAAGSTVAIVGLGPIGDMCARVALHRGARTVIGIDLVADRLDRARRNGVEVLDLSQLDHDELLDAARELTDGRGPDAVIDAVGMEAHGSPLAKAAQRAAGLLPRSVAARALLHQGLDRLAALRLAIDLVRRGGTISIIGVYGGMTDPLPLFTLFDKQIQIRMGQANVRRWVDRLLPLLTDDDPLGVDGFATDRLPIEDAPGAYERFQQKTAGTVKVLLHP